MVPLMSLKFNKYGTLSGGMDYGAIASLATFSASESRACVEISITDDIISEPIELFAVSLTFPGLLPEGIAVMPDSANVTIVDNDGKYMHEEKLF